MIRAVPTWLVRALQLGIALALLALLWRAADGPTVAKSLAGADWRFLALALVALSVQTILSALRWRLTAGQLGMSFEVGHAIREYYLSQVVNQSLPGGMIGDAGRAYRTRAEAGLLAAGQAVVIERLAGQIAMFLTLAVAFLCTTLVAGGLDWPRWLAVPLAVFVVAGLAAPLVLWAASGIGGAIGRAIGRLHELLTKTLTQRDVLPRQVALSIGTAMCNLAAFAFCARAVGVELSLVAVTALVPVILFTMLIPISISGWGLREGAAAALFPLVGASASGGLASSVAFGLTFLVAVLPGVILLRLKTEAPAT
ncbi:MAG: lysylphosphatidylglycerol synthase transmembrane domain-containing protein [Pseudomonadota bacterium]